MDQCFNVLDKLAKSKFRSRFKLRTKELEYIKDKGLDKCRFKTCLNFSQGFIPNSPQTIKLNKIKRVLNEVW